MVDSSKQKNVFLQVLDGCFYFYVAARFGLHTTSAYLAAIPLFNTVSFVGT
jgi:hypothetical protein